MTREATTQLHPAYGSVLLAVAIEPEEIGRRIRSARKARHWTQLEFALEAHISPSTVTRWEHGDLPRVKELLRIADLLDIPAEQLVEPDPEQIAIGAELKELRERQGRLEDMVGELHAALLPDSDTPPRSRRAQGGSQ
jgi:transcriptional regulator with XRE-family HTH domain